MKWKRGGPYGLLKTEVLDTETERCVATVFTKRLAHVEPGQIRRGNLAPWPDGEDNLNMVIAAPELVEALSQTVWLLERLKACNRDFINEIDYVCEEAHAVLAKLKGTQP